MMNSIMRGIVHRVPSLVRCWHRGCLTRAISARHFTASVPQPYDHDSAGARELREDDIIESEDDFLQLDDTQAFQSQHHHQPLVNAFARLSQPPPLSQLVQSALIQSSKHKLSLSWFSLPSESYSVAHKHNHTRTSRRSIAAKQTYKLKNVAKLQLGAIKNALIEQGLSKYLDHFPRLSSLHPFDRALVRLSLADGERDYTHCLRTLRKRERALKALYERAVKAVEASSIGFIAGDRAPSSIISPVVSSILSCTDIDSLLAVEQSPSLTCANRLEVVLAHYKHAMLTAMIDIENDYNAMKTIAKALNHIPIIDRSPHTLTVAMIGVPNVGKSSLISMMSSGKPDIQNYSFTTRGLIVGHLNVSANESVEENEQIEREFATVADDSFSLTNTDSVRDDIDDDEAFDSDESGEVERRRRKILTEHREYEQLKYREQHKYRKRLNTHTSLSSTDSDSHSRVQMIDTPGLLFRPDQCRKRIELLTLTSLHYLSLHCVIFVIDVSQSCGYSLTEQLCVRHEIYRRYHSRIASGEVRWIDCISKSDLDAASFSFEKEFVSDGQQGVDQQQLQQYKQLFSPFDDSSSDGGDQSTEALMNLLPTDTISVSVRHSASLVAFKKRLLTELRSIISKQNASASGSLTIEEEFQQAFAAFHQ